VLDNADARQFLARFVDPIAKVMLKLGVTPDAMTWIGCLASVAVSSLLLSQGHFLVGGILMGLFTLTDLFDGTMARINGTSGAWGAFLDSTLDRVSDAAIFIALGFYYLVVTDPNFMACAASVVALTAALLTSYARAKAESLGAKCNVGIAERAERTALLWVGFMFSGIFFDVMPYVLVALSVLSTITVIQRLLFVRSQLVA
jgi:phosphatidylglycerophosphate synthase